MVTLILCFYFETWPSKPEVQLVIPLTGALGVRVRLRTVTLINPGRRTGERPGINGGEKGER